MHRMDKYDVRKLQELEADVAARMRDLSSAASDNDANGALTAVQAVLDAHNLFYQQLTLALDDLEWFINLTPDPAKAQKDKMDSIHRAAWPDK